MKKTVLFTIIFVICLSMICSIYYLSFYGGGSQKRLLSYIENDDIDKLVLTIRYFDLYLPQLPNSLDFLISQSDEQEPHAYKVVVDGKELNKYKEELIAVATSIPTPVSENLRINAMVYFDLKNKHGKTIFEFIMGGWEMPTAMLVNGKWVEEEDCYYDIVRPFLIESTSPFEF